VTADEATVPDDAPAPPRWSLPLVAVLTGLLYGYELFEGIASLVALPAQLDPSDVPWAGLVVAVAAPPILFVASLLLARRRRPLHQILVMLTGLAATNALALGALTLQLVEIVT